MSMKIRAFVLDEVERQGWIRGSPDFWLRVGAMLAAWSHARAQKRLTCRIVRLWGMMVEPEVNRDGWRTCGVQVGGRVCPEWREVPSRMQTWIWRLPEWDPDEAYVKFEMIHPFLDGNGRTGKIIHNFLCGTLEGPVLVKDYFGGGLP